MKKYLYILLTIFISLDVFLIFKINRKNNFLKQCIASEENSTISLDKIIESQLLQYKYDGKRLIVENVKILDTIQVLKNGPKLLLIINVDVCESCVDFALADLTEIEQKIGQNNIVILTRFPNDREAKYLSKRLGDKFQIVNISSGGALFNDAFISLSPIFLILERELISNYIFLYSPNYPKLNEAYKNFVIDYFTNTNSPSPMKNNLSR